MTAVQTKGFGKVEYKQLAKAKISKNRNLVISECSKGGFTIAQQVVVSDDVAEVSLFMKGAYHIASLDELIAVRDAMDEAIASVVKAEEENEVNDGINWDES